MSIEKYLDHLIAKGFYRKNIRYSKDVMSQAIVVKYYDRTHPDFDLESLTTREQLADIWEDYTNNWNPETQKRIDKEDYGDEDEEEPTKEVKTDEI